MSCDRLNIVLAGAATALALAAVLAGCGEANSPQASSVALGSPTAQPPSDAHKMCAECLVCKENGDLACLRVEVDASTPALEFEGTTYYFCSAECRAAFAKDPRRYIPKRD